MLSVNISLSNFSMKCIRQYFAVKRLHYRILHYCIVSLLLQKVRISSLQCLGALSGLPVHQVYHLYIEKFR